MKTATQVAGPLENFRGDARVFKLSEPHAYESWDDEKAPETYDHVIVAAAVVAFDGPETYIFGAKQEDGQWEIANWREMAGSFKGALDHEKALQDAGYKLENPPGDH